MVYLLDNLHTYVCTVVPPLSELTGPWLCLDNRKVQIIEFVSNTYV